MKKFTHYAAALAVACMALVSCTSDLKETSGDYTFKTSGTVTLTSAEKTETVVLNNETGTLSIINRKDNHDGVILTINSSYGPIQTADARIAGKSVLVDAYTRTLEFTELNPQILQSDLVKTTFDDVKVTGSGERYDDTIIFTWTYEGVSTDGKVTLKGENIKTVATRK